MSAMKKIRQKVMVGEPLKMNHVVDEVNKKCEKECEESEEEDKIWKSSDDSLKGVRANIESLNDPRFDWSHLTVDGKESNVNFKEWLESVCEKFYEVKKKTTDNEIFE